MTKPIDNCDIILTAQAAADLFGVTRETLSRMAKVQGLPKVKMGQYHLKEIHDWRLNLERDKNNQTTPADKKARMEVAHEQAKRYRIENATKMGELLPATDVQAAINQMASTMASMLDGLGPRMAVELSQVGEPAQIQRMLLDECRAIRDAASSAFVTLASDINGVEDTDTTTKPKRGGVGKRKSGATARKSRARKVED